MIDLSNLQPAPNAITVPPSDKIFDELGRNTYDYKDLLSELIDNAIAARRLGGILEVVIDIYVDSNLKPQEFVIRDNAKGISPDIFGLAISPAGLQSRNSLNEHGLGMKQAVAALGKLKYLATKTREEPKARLIQEFRFGDIPTFQADFDRESGTEIMVTDLKPIVTANPTNYTRTIVPYLGARYRRYLRPDSRNLQLKIYLRSSEQPDNIQYDWTVQEVKPVYFHPSTRINEPVILRYPLEGDGWTAELTFGYAPTKREEYEELGIDAPNKFHPYRISLSTQGLDVILQDRVILFHQLSELGFIDAKHNDYNDIRGEIDLKHGFATAITKNSMISDEHFVECIRKVDSILNGDFSTVHFHRTVEVGRRSTHQKASHVSTRA